MRFIGRTESRSIHESVAVAEKQQEALLLFAISSEISRELMCASACVCVDGRGSGASRSRAKRKAQGWFGLWFKIIKRKKNIFFFLSPNVTSWPERPRSFYFKAVRRRYDLD